MNKTLLVVLLGPFVLVAAVCVSPFACLYFLFDRLCDCIEEFKPRANRRTKKKPGRAAQLGRVLSLIPNRGLQQTTDNKEG
ncbi:MAG: hypothetical protein EOO37_00055 [Cytophagaceae bacterium]|nr:MAG: hypothetical protein EOO37_00055 [Cytophagaceae bacterium]